MALDTLQTPQGVFDRRDELQLSGHEQVVFCNDTATGLRAIIAIHDTSRGPAMGGTRFYPYANEAAALTDVLRLSEGMTFKAAAAGMPLGGGKAVILGDPETLKSPELLRAYGRFVERLGGWYYTAADVGTTSEDLDVIGQETRYVTGRTRTAGGSGDSGLSTATGVFHAMRAAANTLWGEEGLRGRTVGVEGAGKVGRHLVGLLLDEGASVVVCDPSPSAVRRLRELHGDQIAVAPSVIELPIDVYSPCALGAALTPRSVPELRATLVCGAANNQLLTSTLDADLSRRGITWVPDYVANAGGLIQVGGELQERTPQEVLDDVRRIGGLTRKILAMAQERRIPTGAAAAEIVQARLSRARSDAA